MEIRKIYLINECLARLHLAKRELAINNFFYGQKKNEEL